MANKPALDELNDNPFLGKKEAVAYSVRGDRLGDFPVDSERLLCQRRRTRLLNPSSEKRSVRFMFTGWKQHEVVVNRHTRSWPNVNS
jgi:hypothetical protein